MREPNLISEFVDGGDGLQLEGAALAPRQDSAVFRVATPILRRDVLQGNWRAEMEFFNGLTVDFEPA